MFWEAKNLNVCNRVLQSVFSDGVGAVIKWRFLTGFTFSIWKKGLVMTYTDTARNEAGLARSSRSWRTWLWQLETGRTRWAGIEMQWSHRLRSSYKFHYLTDRTFMIVTALLQNSQPKYPFKSVCWLALQYLIWLFYHHSCARHRSACIHCHNHRKKKLEH